MQTMKEKQKLIKVMKSEKGVIRKAISEEKILEQEKNTVMIVYQQARLFSTEGV